MTSPAAPRVVRIEKLALKFAPRPWAFAQERRAEILAYFDTLKRDKPLWNGPILLQYEYRVEGDVLHGSYFETDFASFIAWRDWGFPDKTIRNCFALGALEGADGNFLLGVMSGHTANAGKIYFPGGTPDHDDIMGDAVDLEGSVRREVEEETGLRPEDFAIDTGWYAVFAGPRTGLMKPMRAREPTQSLRQRVLDYLARQTEPELSDMLIVRGPADLDPRIPDFVLALLNYRWSLAKPDRAG